MSYRVDIPTLSANEVYTLTFEYEGTETIQLIVGDLTLETTDRRVVFTTTSPVNYIESNVNLTNLNMYEGYYESDDFGGEYIQESYIEGKSLVNLCEIKFIGDTSSWKYQMTGYDEEGYMHIIPRLSGYSNYYKVYPKDQPWRTKYGTYTLVIDFTSTLPNKTVDTCWESSSNAGNSQQKYKDFTYNGGQSRKYVVTFITSETQSYYMELNLGDLDLTTNTSGEVLVSYMVVEGDYFDEFCKEEKTKSWVGIGCVKSPKILSQTKHRNIMINTKPSATTNLITVSDDNTYIYLAEAARYSGLNFKFTQEYLAQHGISNGDKLCIELDGRLIEGTGTQAAKTSTRIGIDSCTWSDGTSGMDTAYKNLPENGHYCDYITINGNVGAIGISFLNNPDWSGTNKIYEIQNFRVYKIEDISEMGTYDCCKLTTPDDLELYDVHYGNGNIAKQDKLDLTTGIVTRNVCKWKLNDYLASNLNYWNFREWNKKDETTNEYVRIQVGVSGVPNGRPTLARGWSEVYGLYFDYWDTDYGASYLYDGKTYFYATSSGVFFMCSKAQILSWTGVESYELLTKQHIYDWFVAGDFTMMNALSEPTTEQISLNALKSYRNGSIQTSSQQLVPTLKTTLPISNKFTTTNLTSGSTYNVYFDGTATKLDAGGTIITNPISPCEVECGGTTLTIEGTDIQNVRVLETTVKNEVGSNGTSDVELSRIKTANSPSDSLISTKIEYWEQTTEYGNALRYVLPIQVKPNTKYILNTTNIQRLFAIWDVNRNQLVLQNIYANSPYIWTTPADCPSEVYLYLVYQTDVNRAHLDELRMFEGEIDFGYQGQQEPLISQTISTLEQPVKLRSLGTTYDSYNPVTGELIKRIGISETDGSYSVLSSPIVSQVEIDNIPHLYTNGQVKVYSDSEVYPTTILNGQSTNNYEISELNTSSNYTIRYDGECESINLAKKSNTQGTNRIVKSGATSGNLTFVNDSGDINNVLLVQNDVREQEINHFNGLQTVEINQLFVSSKQNLFEAYMKNDFDYENVTPWNTSYSSLHRGVFNCGVSVAGNNSQLTFDVIHPKIGGGISEETPIMKAGKIYNISCGITVNDDTSNRKYDIAFYNKSGSQIYAQKIDNISPVLSINTTANNTNTTAKINANTFFNEDVHDIRLHAIYGGTWKFDCTITDFTICEPENAKPEVPLVYEYIDLPQPVQLNSLPDGTCDTYNPITGEYVQNVGYVVYDDTTTWNTYAKDFYYTSNFAHNEKFITYHKNLEEKVASQLWTGDSGFAIAAVNLIRVVGLQSKDEFLEYMKQYPLQIIYGRKEPIVTQLTPITIPTFEGGILQLITTDGKVFPMVEYSMPTNNRYDTSSWEAGKVYTQRNMTEVYFNDSTTPMTPTETMTLTTDHISSGSIILNDNGNGLIVLKGNYTGRDIPYFTGMRSVEAIEVETTPSPDQPLFGKGGRK